MAHEGVDMRKFVDTLVGICVYFGITYLVVYAVCLLVGEEFTWRTALAAWMLIMLLKGIL